MFRSGRVWVLAEWTTGSRRLCWEQVSDTVLREEAFHYANKVATGVKHSQQVLPQASSRGGRAWQTPEERLVGHRDSEALARREGLQKICGQSIIVLSAVRVWYVCEKRCDMSSPRKTWCFLVQPKQE